MFRRLRRIQSVTQRYFPCLRTRIDTALVIEIGYYEGQGRPLTSKALLLLKLGAPATVSRHLKRLVDLGLVHKCHPTHDKRICQYEVDPALRRRFIKYAQLISRLSRADQRKQTLSSGADGHAP